MENVSSFKELFKAHKGASSQEERRRQVLEKQKEERSKTQDSARKLKELVDHVRKKKRRKTYEEKYGTGFTLQLSEWLKEAPEDLDRWFLVPCPVGTRCLIVANSGRTEMYHKSGRLMYTFRSTLPGDGLNRNSATILDCVYVEKLSTFYVLDAVAFGSHNLSDCETEFRFFWIKSRFADNPLTEISSSNEYAFRPLDFYDFDDPSAIESCLLRYPIWDENLPALDGFLFYHKDASYVCGETPLVGWLFAFMVPEVLGVNVHDAYLEKKPADYENYVQYISKFDETYKKPRRRRRKKTSDEESDMVVDVLDAERHLELHGDTVDSFEMEEFDE